MANTLSGAMFRISLNGSVTAPAGASVAQLTAATNAALATAIASGTGNGQANAIVSYAGTVSTGTPVTVDLCGLAGLVNPTLLTGIKAILIQNQSQTVGQDLTFGDVSGVITNEWTAPFGTAAGAIIAHAGSAAGQPLGAIAMQSPIGYAVDGSHHLLTVTAAAGTNVPFQIDIIGTV